LLGLKSGSTFGLAVWRIFWNCINTLLKIIKI